MSHNARGALAPEQVKRHATTVRINDADKDGLRSMTEEHPLYTESVIIRAALQVLLACSNDVRTAIVIASLNEKNVSEVMRRHGMGALSEQGAARAV
ncbi:hypothetical protein [Pantoea sp. At-9b]|uniref:hypothetical protein n=1 Tax=Pantoea sp. (strain At-9b) TaxID=592316 RepID=UPI0001B3F888|nr:hypothetical protein [Pantoea sp. At-9b]ADU73058.1 hypothetical protein Pat9b_4078 [Pantoea sp. At-9b]